MPKNEHEFKETIVIDIFYPDHPPRTESKLFSQTKRHLVKVLDIPCWVCGTKEKREVHHFHAEWADAAGIDWDKMRVLHPAFAWSTFREPSDFIDSEYNMMVLCLTPDTKVLMGDGTEKVISDIVVGDEVIGHDGIAHRVLSAIAREHSGEIYNVDGVRASGNHPFLTPDGWINAENLSVGQIVYQFGMGFSQMVRLRGIKNKVLNAIVGFLPIDVMNSLLSGKASPDMALHNVPMFHHKSPGARGVTHKHSDISFGANANTGYFFECPGQTVQPEYPAFIGAKSFSSPSLFPRKNNHLLSTAAALFRNLFFANRLATNGGALPRASAVLGINSGSNKKFSLANFANFINARFHIRTGWRSINHVVTSVYVGKLYDITVEGSHSFVANKIAVHNCETHHRARDHGIHLLPYPIWIMQRDQLASFVFAPEAA